MWVTLIITIITYLLQKKKGVSTNKAALGALAVGAGTYYVATETDWGKATLGELDTSIDNAMTSPAGSTKTGTTTSNGPLRWLSDNAGTVAATVGGAALLGSAPSWLLPVGILAGIYFVAKG